MLIKIKQFLKRIFSKRFIAPIINEKLATAIDDKIIRRRKDQEKKTQEHTDILNSFLKTYFSRKYNNSSDMLTAFNTCNKHWKKHCVLINSTEKLINLKKDAFEKNVEKVINKLKENELHTK